MQILQEVGNMKKEIILLGADTAEDIDQWPSFNSLFPDLVQQ